MKRWFLLIGFLVLTVGGGLTIGSITQPGEWYAHLAKPSFNPPSRVFAPVWTSLYIFIAVGGWRAWQLDRGGRRMWLWWGQLGLNFLWSPLFFGAHLIGLAFVTLLLLLVMIVSFIIASIQKDRVAILLFA